MSSSNDLLCERCGYVISGLPREGACPECGRPIPDSHPDHRTGSRWQRRPGILAIFYGIGSALGHPRSSWEYVAIDLPSGSGALWAHCACAALIFPGVAFVGSAMHHVAAIGPAILASFVWFVLLLVLSFVESLGVRTIGKLRKLRISKGVAFVIVGHAAAGWGIGAVVGTITTMVLIWADAFWTRLPALGVGAAAAFVVGLLAFEVLTFFGLRRLRFANPPVEIAAVPALTAGSAS